MASSLRARSLPHDDDGCGWITELGPRPAGARPQLAGDHRADTVVIGAGLTGLAAARRLAELDPNARIVLLEAQRAGFGASARSSGFLVDIAFFTTAMEPEAAERHVRLSRAGIESLRTRVRDHGIECAWDDTGWIHAAAGPDGVNDLETLAGWLENRGEAFDDLDAAAMERETGTPFYRRGLRLPGRPLLHPAALVRGLAEALPAGVSLHEESPVLALHRTSGSWRVETDRGTVTAPRVILALNGYAPAIRRPGLQSLPGGPLSRRVFPLITFGSLTRPLTADEQDRVGARTEWGLLAQDPLGSSLRRTRDQRILVRNTLLYDRSFVAGPGARRAARRAHRRALARRWPDLFGPEGIELEHTWAGVMGASATRRHLFDRLDDGLWAAAGFTGAGIAMGTVAGELLAEWSAGGGSERLRDMRALPGPGKTPPEPFLSLGIRWTVRRMNASAREFL